MRKTLSTLLIILFGLGVWFFLFFRLFYLAEHNNPGITKYGYPININNDYYAYLYFIKSGLEGKLYFENVFTDVSQPKQITEPHYFIVGFLARPLGLSAVDIFFLLRIISPCIFIIFYIYLVRKIIDVWWG